MTIFLVAVIVAALWAFVDFFVAGSGITRMLWRRLRSRFTATIEIDMPPELGVTAANGLLDIGSQLIVGSEAEWAGSRIVAFAISPQLIPMPLGTRFEVVQVGPNRLRLRQIPAEPVADRR